MENNKKEKSMTTINWTRVLTGIVAFLVSILISLTVYVYKVDKKERTQVYSTLIENDKKMISKNLVQDIKIDVLTEFIEKKYDIDIDSKIWRRMYIETVNANAIEISNNNQTPIPPPFPQAENSGKNKSEVWKGVEYFCNFLPL